MDGHSPAECASRKESMAATQCSAGPFDPTRSCHSRACQCGTAPRSHSRIQSGRYRRHRSNTRARAVRELEPLARIAVREIAAHRSPPPFARKLGQEVMDTPAQPRRRERLRSGELRDHASHDRPRELGRPLEADVGRDAERARELEREPLPDGGMGDHDPLRRERIARGYSHQLRELGGQHLHPVRLAQAQRAQPSSFATPFGTCPMAPTPRAASQWRRWSSKKMSAPNARRNPRFSLPPRKRASSMRMPHARRVRTTRSWAGVGPRGHERRADPGADSGPNSAWRR